MPDAVVKAPALDLTNNSPATATARVVLTLVQHRLVKVVLGDHLKKHRGEVLLPGHLWSLPLQCPSPFHKWQSRAAVPSTTGQTRNTRNRPAR